MTTLYLVRHAQSLPLPHVNEADWQLSAVGADQAQRLVPVLARLGVRRVYSSPYLRCRETLAPFAAAVGCEVVLHEGLRERRIAGQWVADFRDVWRRSWEDFSYLLEGGECSWDCRARIGAAAQEIVARHPGETLALGSHGNAIGLFLHFVDAGCGIAEASRLRTPEILKVVYDGTTFSWDRAFAAGEDFERLATDFRLTPGIVA